MKSILGLALLVSSCAMGMNDTGHAFSDARRVAPVYPAVTIDIRDDIVLTGYDLDFDGDADVLLAHKHLGEGIQTERPFQYIWVNINKKGNYEAYARQTDIDADGKFENVSGDVKQMNKWLDKLE